MKDHTPHFIFVLYILLLEVFRKIPVLRFPLKQNVLLITTAGCITCKITRATSDFLFCENVEYEGMNLNSVYVDRSSVIAFTSIEENKEEELLENKINSAAKIIRFELLKKVNS